MMIMMMLGGDIDDAFYCFGWWSRWQALATGSDSPFCPSGGLAHEREGTDDDDEEAQRRVKIDNLRIRRRRRRRRRRRWTTTTTTMAITMTTGPGTVLHRW